MDDEIWNVDVGVHVGPFYYGQVLKQSVHVLLHRSHSHKFNLIYDESNENPADIIIQSHEDGLLLRFDEETQQLKAIELLDPIKLSLKYQQKEPFTGPTAVSNGGLSFPSLYKLFGPTQPGYYDPTQASYILEYARGIRLFFSIPDAYQSLYLSKNNTLPMELPDGTSPQCHHMLFSSGYTMTVDEEVSGQTVAAPRVLPPCRSFPSYFQIVKVTWVEGQATLEFSALPSSCTSSKSRTCLTLNTSCQEMFSVLGPCVATYDKPNGDTFYNYPHLGLDILCSATTHRSIKFVLHTNRPGHPDFNAYMKCNFALVIPPTTTAREVETTTTSRPCRAVITPAMKWEELQRVYALSPMSLPVILDGGAHTHPFGSTECYTPFPNITFEIMRSGYIASVFLV